MGKIVLLWLATVVEMVLAGSITTCKGFADVE